MNKRSLIEIERSKPEPQPVSEFAGREVRLEMPLARVDQSSTPICLVGETRRDELGL